MINYYLHDCIINSICINDSKLILSFAEGVYPKDKNNKTPPCRMEISIDDLNTASVQEHITIYAFKGDKRSEISFEDLRAMLNHSELRVYLDYHSDFCKGMLLKCNFPEMEIEIQITEIVGIAFPVI